MTLHDFTVRPRPQPADRRVGHQIARVTRVTPVHVTVDGRDYGPLLRTSRAASLTLTVGELVLVAALTGSSTDPDRYVLIDTLG